jgi:hypothetical protein
MNEVLSSRCLQHLITRTPDGYKQFKWLAASKNVVEQTHYPIDVS